jgi:hypothetical protein
LTASVLFPNISAPQIIGILATCGVAAALGAGYGLVRRHRGGAAVAEVDRTGRENWRMPALNLLEKPVMSSSRKIGMAALRLYLAVAMILVVVKIVQLAVGH